MVYEGELVGVLRWIGVAVIGLIISLELRTTLSNVFL